MTFALLNAWATAPRRCGLGGYHDVEPGRQSFAEISSCPGYPNGFCARRWGGTAKLPIRALTSAATRGTRLLARALLPCVKYFVCGLTGRARVGTMRAVTAPIAMGFFRKFRIFRLLVILVLLGGGALYHSNPQFFQGLQKDFSWSGDAPGEAAAATTTQPAETSPAAVAVAPAAVAPAAPVWTAPALIPLIPGGTLTTPDAQYTNARIVKVNVDRVTITYDGGRVVIPTWQLPSALQRQLNYDPKLAETAAAQRQSTDAPVAEAAAQPDVPSAPAAQAFTETTDYATGLASAKTSGRKVLLHFTGSDWCGYCQLLDKEVLSTSAFNQFAAANYVIVTLDFPHDIPLPANVKEQNDRLAQKYNVTGYPTLVVLTTDERELGRIGGYNPGSGPDAVIGQLRNYSGK